MDGIGVDIVKNQLLAIPALRERRASNAAPYVPAKNSVDWVRSIFANASERIAARRPLNGSMLEIGPGGNLGPTLLFLEAGCQAAVCLDIEELASDQGRLYRELVPHADDLLEKLTYRSHEALEGTSLPSDMFDIAFSSACFEHVADPSAALHSLFRLLKPGGVTTHGIDLRDHRNFGQPLNFLRHSDRIWRAATSRRMFTNRWRASDWERGFTEAGFVDVEVSPHEQISISERDRASFHPMFRRESLANLGVLQANVTATKPE